MRNLSTRSGPGKFILLAITLVLAGCSLQTKRKPALPQDLTVRQTWEVPGMSRDQLFDAANRWMRTAFSDDVDIVQYANRRQGIVMGKAFIGYQRPNAVGINEKYDLRFNVVVEIRDDKIRTTFSDLHLFSLNEIGTIYDTDIKIIRQRLNRRVENWVASMSSVKKDDTW